MKITKAYKLWKTLYLCFYEPRLVDVYFLQSNFLYLVVFQGGCVLPNRVCFSNIPKNPQFVVLFRVAFPWLKIRYAYFFDIYIYIYKYIYIYIYKSKDHSLEDFCFASSRIDWHWPFHWDFFLMPLPGHQVSRFEKQFCEHGWRVSRKFFACWWWE